MYIDVVCEEVYLHLDKENWLSSLLNWSTVHIFDQIIEDIDSVAHHFCARA
jgi:hypothetical protein